MAEEVQVDSGLQKELNDLDQKIDPNQQVAEATDTKENLIIEKDGDFYLKSESDEVEPVADPDEGQAAEQDSPTASDEGQETSEKEPSQYQSKSREDLLEMLTNSQKKIGEQGNELGELRKIAQKPEELSDEEVFSKLSGDDIETGLAEEKAKLDIIDPYDDAAVNEQKELVRQMESDLINKRTQEAIATRFNSRDNQDFIDSMKEDYQKQGIELSDDEFTTVVDSANSYTESGLLTERSFQKAMIDKFGVDKIVKHYQMNGEQKARTDIQRATAKTSEKVDVRGAGKNAKMVKIADLSQKELRETLDNLSYEELQKINQQVNR
tara:strand:+ start:2218 stop:3189 length:972 start_codon:yes stop_codon:yes gene_type:complete